ncbi:MAG: O-antigen ligase family protein [Pseudomonadota bacterium]
MQGFKRVWPLVLFFYSLLLPPEIFFEISGFRFYAFRIVEFALFPVVLIQMLQGRIRINIVDLLNIFSAAWLVISFSVIHDFMFAIESGASLAADALIAYFLARCSIRNLADLRLFLTVIIPGVSLASAMLVIESLGGKLLLRPAVAEILGSREVGAFGLRNEKRLGFLRAYGPFYHPIMAGMFLTSLLPLYMLAMKPGRTKIVGIASSLGALFSFSSSAFLGVATISGLYGYERLCRVVRELSWPLLVMVAFVILILLHFFSQDGLIAVLNRYLLLNPSTGYYRTLIWQYAGAEALANPVFGIGRNEWLRPLWMGSNSIDAHFLLLAVKNGMPAAISAFLAYVIAIIVLSKRVSDARTTEYRNVYLGLAIALAVVLIGQFTVSAVLTTQAIVLIIQGIGTSLAFQSRKVVQIPPSRPYSRAPSHA